MKDFFKKIPDGVLPAKTVEIQQKNIELLEEHALIQEILRQSHIGSIEGLSYSTANIPRSLEYFLIVDFEKKRGLICDLLFTIHQEYTHHFPLDQYLFATKKIFSIITQFCWAREDVSFVLKIIIAYLRQHARYISTEKFLSFSQQFEAYGPWTEDDIRNILVHSTCIELVQSQAPTMIFSDRSHIPAKKTITKRHRKMLHFLTDIRRGLSL